MFLLYVYALPSPGPWFFCAWFIEWVLAVFTMVRGLACDLFFYANVSHACNASLRLTNRFLSHLALCSQHNWCCCDGPRYRSRRSNTLPLLQVWKVPKKDAFFNRSACREDKRDQFTHFRCLPGTFNTIWNNTRGLARTPRTARRGETCRA